MTKMTYGEQLKHPNWQRKRLEVLEAYGFRCNACHSTEKTLHVHHKHYVKGRQVWEYALGELEALCEDCHKDAHEAKERLDRIVAQYPSVMWAGLADLLLGFGDEYVDPAEWEFVGEGPQARCGQIAGVVSYLSAEEAFEAAQCAMSIGWTSTLEVLREAAKPF